MNALLPIARITDDEFEAMIGKGAAEVLGRVELRDGALYRMNPQYLPHMRAKIWLLKRIDEFLGGESGLEVGSEVTVRFGGGFAPLPDVVVFAPTPSQKALPGEAVRLIVEVADTTLADDLGDKRDAYAHAGVPEYWVYDLSARALHRFATPGPDGYGQAAVFRVGEAVQSLTLPGLVLTLAPPAG